MRGIQIPLARAQVTGAIKTNPARFKDRADPKTNPIGFPPNWMTEQQRECWHMFRHEIPWLTEADRIVVEIASVLRSRMIHEHKYDVPSLTLLRQCASVLGATPSDRGKISLPDENKVDPTDKHFN